MTTLKNKRVAILATNGFEQSELESPQNALVDAGAQVDIVSLSTDNIKGWDEDNWGDEVQVDIELKDADHSTYDALVLPGGLINPDTLRQEEDAISFVKSFFSDDRQRPVAAICHGPWLLVEAGVIDGKTLTSFPSIKTDLQNAGAHWVDKTVAKDGQIITSRKPDDLDKFNQTLIKAIAT